jgi:hypothetical protein
MPIVQPLCRAAQSGDPDKLCDSKMTKKPHLFANSCSSVHPYFQIGKGFVNAYAGSFAVTHGKVRQNFYAFNILFFKGQTESAGRRILQVWIFLQLFSRLDRSTPEMLMITACFPADHR